MKKLFSIKRLLPRKLSRQLQLASTLILTVSLLGFTGYSVWQLDEVRTGRTGQEARLLVQTIAQLSSLYILHDNRMQLSQQLKQVVSHPDIISIQIQDNQNNIIISLRKDDKNHLSIVQDAEGLLPPEPGGGTLIQEKNYFHVWEEIIKLNTPNRIGWVSLIFSLESNKEINIEFLKRSITIALMAIAVCIFLLHLLMVKPMRALKKAAEFSERLEKVRGKQLDVDDSAEETQSLTNALNRTSLQLHKQEQAQYSSRLLFDAIAEVQSLYISRSNTDKLFETVLKVFLRITKSEIGFIGEVLTSEATGSSVRVLAMSKVTWKGSIEDLPEKYSSKNFTFDYLDNLFGCVAQTRKPVITNDPLTDPRAKGTPEGHPMLNTFLGIPIFCADRIVGIVNIANRVEGYDQALVDYLQPFLNTVGYIMDGHHKEQYRCRMQQELQDNKLLIESILKTVDDAIITVSKDGYIETMNPATETIFGFAKDQLIKQSINKLVPGFHQDINSSLLVNSPAVFDKLHRDVWDMDGLHKSKKLFPVEISVNKFLTGEEIKYTITIRDVSAHKHTEQILRRNAKQLSHAQQLAHLGSWEFNPQDKNMQCSDELYNLMGINKPLDDCLYDHFLNALHPQDRSVVMSAMEIVSLNEKFFHIEHRMVLPSGEERCMYSQGQLEYDASRNLCMVVGTTQDITERKAFSQMKDDFITAVGYELRKPLSSIQELLTSIKQDSRLILSDQSSQLLAKASVNTSKMMLLVNDILDVEKTPVDTVAYDMQLVNWPPFVQHVVEANQYYCDEYNLALKLANNSPDVDVLIDQPRLLQAMSYIIASIAKGSAMNNVLEVVVETKKRWVYLAFIGYQLDCPEVQKLRLFQAAPAFSNNAEFREKKQDLRLNITKEIIKTHSGALHYHCIPDIAEAFYIELPVAQQASVVINE